MSFWNIEEPATGEFEVGGGEMKPIPADTSCLATIDEAKWSDDRNGNRFVSLRWSVLQPAEYKNRKIYQKLWVTDADPKAKDADKKRDKAKRMLAAIDFNAGGKLKAAGVEPTDDSLGIALINKPMIIKVMEWKITDEVTGEIKSGNWIGAVSARSKTSAPIPAPVKTEDVPF